MDAAAPGHCDWVGRGRAWEFTEGVGVADRHPRRPRIRRGRPRGRGRWWSRWGRRCAKRSPSGGCANDTTSAQAGGTDAIDCAEPHRYEVYAVLTHSEARGAAYPGDQGVQKDEQKRCGDAFTDFVDVRPDDSPTLKFVWAGPNQETWNDGERNFQCVLFARSEEMLTGSMKGTRN
jgi:hypothetical protein